MVEIKAARPLLLELRRACLVRDEADGVADVKRIDNFRKILLVSRLKLTPRFQAYYYRFRRMSHAGIFGDRGKYYNIPGKITKTEWGGTWQVLDCGRRLLGSPIKRHPVGSRP